MCYNQEQYIEEAFRAALAQTYSPLEIIVSDDCSIDRSFEIIKRLASEYHGKHRILIHRNEHNLGMIKNWEKLCSLASGELIVKADGDDISMANRVQRLVDDWIYSGRRAIIIASSYEKIDLEGKLVGEKILPDGWDSRSIEEIIGGAGFNYGGASFMIHRSLFDDFPSISYVGAMDDTVYEARGLMCHKFETLRKTDLDKDFFAFRTIPEKLVKYRVGCGTTTGGKYRSFMLRGIIGILESRKQTLLDLEKARDYLESTYFTKVYNCYLSSMRHQELVVKLYSGKTYRERLYGYRNIYTGKRFSVPWIISLILILPPTIGDMILSILQKIKH